MLRVSAALWCCRSIMRGAALASARPAHGAHPWRIARVGAQPVRWLATAADAANPDAAKPKSDTSQSDAPKPDAPKPEASKGKAAPGDTARPKAKADTPRPDTSKTDPAKDESAKSDAAKPKADAAKLDAAKPDAAPKVGRPCLASADHVVCATAGTAAKRDMGSENFKIDPVFVKSLTARGIQALFPIQGGESRAV